MAIMTERDLECFICRKGFRAVCGDFIFAPEIICEACLAELRPLSEADLSARLASLLASRGITDPKTLETVIAAVRRPLLPRFSSFQDGT